ncbi:MAG: biotin transporter BioY [Lachnospiraceae bacterium]
MRNLKVYQMAIIALFTAVACIIGPMSIPIGTVPVSFTIMVMYLSVVIQGWKSAELSCIIYLLLGAVGVPVFSAYGAGLGKLLGPTGGYLIGYLLMIPVIGIFMNLAEKIGEKKYTPVYFIITFIGMVLGTAVAYALGTAWYMVVMKVNLGAALASCVMPFIGFDLVKIVIALAVGSFITKQLTRAGLGSFSK